MAIYYHRHQGIFQLPVPAADESNGSAQGPSHCSQVLSLLLPLAQTVKGDDAPTRVPHLPATVYRKFPSTAVSGGSINARPYPYVIRTAWNAEARDLPRYRLPGPDRPHPRLYAPRPARGPLVHGRPAAGHAAADGGLPGGWQVNRKGV